MFPVAFLIYVSNIDEGLKWYKKAFSEATLVYHAESDFYVLSLNGLSLEIVQSDEKVGAGKNGTVVYWGVSDLEFEMNRLLSLGANLYRGPMTIEAGLVMCQLVDPFGNLIGLRGRAT